ncbi:unnamed protein product [Arabidopsis lyrata]|nr:unnamed protein product [Arabidopsis lyrata]
MQIEIEWGKRRVGIGHALLEMAETPQGSSMAPIKMRGDWRKRRRSKLSNASSHECL